MGFDLFSRIQKFKVLLKEKEESVRKLKELLRKSQQHGEESCKTMERDLSCQDLSIWSRCPFIRNLIHPY